MINVDLDVKDFLRSCDDVAKKQMPYAVMKALNETATDFQKMQRQSLNQDFTLRRKEFIDRTIKIEKGNFATKDNLRVIVNIDPQRDVLSKFEKGGEKEPTRGGKSIALPITVRRSKTDIIKKAERPRSFQFTKGSSNLKTQNTIYQGLKRTFLIQRPNGFGLILQRTRSTLLGPFQRGTRGSSRLGRNVGHDPNVRILYALVAKTHIPKMLHFKDNAHKAVLSRWPGNFEKWFLESLRTKKG
jgi:hypothetical protein